MHPVLFKIGWFEARTYGLMLMISFMVGIYIAIKRAKKENVDPNLIVDLSIIIIISSLIGSRALYVAFHFDEFRDNLVSMINPFQSGGLVGIAGMTVLGGVILAIACSFLFLRNKKMPVLRIFNILTPSIALGTGITRIGCFFHGCCYGTICNNFFGVIFPSNSMPGYMFPNTPIHPTQLYASFGSFVIFGLLLYFERISFFKDKTFFLFLIFYGIYRFTVDIFRYYEESMIIARFGGLNLSLNQGISIFLLVIGLCTVVYFWYIERKR